MAVLEVNFRHYKRSWDSSSMGCGCWQNFWRFKWFPCSLHTWMAW